MTAPNPAPAMSGEDSRTQQAEKKMPKYKVWRASEGEWVCLLTSDGIVQVTLSLTETEAADLRCKLMKPGALLIDSNGDAGECERLYPLKAGHVLTEQDATDLQNLIADFNDEIQGCANAFHDGRVDAFREIGREELAVVAAERDEAMFKACVARALAKFREKIAQDQAERISHEPH